MFQQIHSVTDLGKEKPIFTSLPPFGTLLAEASNVINPIFETE